MGTIGIDIRNPYTSEGSGMHVSSGPGDHHRVVGGDFAMDINMPGMEDAGKKALLDIVPTGDAREVRGVVVQGGTPEWFACASGNPNDGGWAIKLRLEARSDGGDWTPVGEFSVLHLEKIPAKLKPGVPVSPGDLLGVATGKFGGRCSGGPHLHCEAASEGRTIPRVDLNDPLSDASVLFSLSIGADESGFGPHPGALSEAARMATSLHAYYAAMKRSLPSRAVRAGIYQGLKLGAAAAYRGTIDQNSALLKALKSRAIAPRSVDEL